MVKADEMVEGLCYRREEKMSGIESKRWTPLDEVFIYRLKTLHSILAPLVHDSLRDKLPSDKAFKERYEEWVRRQGWTLDEERQLNVANQAAYIMINKILFYKALERKKNLPSLTKAENVTELLKKLRLCFDNALKIDYRAVFQKDPIYDEIPLTPEIANILNIIIEEVSEYDLSDMRRDIIGSLYQKLIPADERRNLGQFYTPPQIIELIVKLCIESSEDKILDPACGSGGFLVDSYDTLLRLKGKTKPDNETHQELLNQLWGVDINKFAAHLATINLATQNLESKSDFVNVIVSDFFDIREPEQRILAPWSALTPDGEREILEIPRFSVVMANPPYTRSKYITNKEEKRKHLKRIGYGDISARSDIYCYFFTHASEFLKEKGRIGFITSDRWLDVGYGEDLQRFFLDNFKIRTIILFDKKAFEEPLIGSCVTILEKCKSKSERDRNHVKFMRIKKRMSIIEVVEKIKTDLNCEISEENEKYNMTIKVQNSLYKEDKWNRFFIAPPIYFDIRSHEKTCKLGEVAEIRRGITSGCNDFFYFEGRDEVDKYDLWDFVSPIIRTIGRRTRIKFTAKDTRWFALDIHHLVKDILSSLPRSNRVKSENLSSLVKNKLGQKGFLTLVKYIEKAENAKDFYLKSTCGSRRVWFDLGEIKRSPLVSLMFYWSGFIVLYNVDRLGADAYYYHITPKKIDVELLGGILNSTLTRLFVEIDGRVAKGAGMDRIQLKVYETRKLTIPDPRKFSREEKEDISSIFKEIIARESHCSKAERRELQRKLDRAVLKTLGMEHRIEELNNAIEELFQRRRMGGTKQTEVLVGPEISGAEVAESRELEEIVQLLQLSKIGQITEEQKQILGQRAGKIVRDIVYELIKLHNEPMHTKEITANLLNIEDKILRLAGYFDVIRKVMGGKIPPSQVIRDLVDIWRDRPEGIERTISRLLSADGRLVKIDPKLIGLSEWSANKLFQIYVQLVSKYRITDYEKKETFKGEAIRLLESNEVDFPDKDGLIQTLRRL